MNRSVVGVNRSVVGVNRSIVGVNRSVVGVLGSLFCMIQCHGFNSPLSFWWSWS